MLLGLIFILNSADEDFARGGDADTDEIFETLELHRVAIRIRLLIVLDNLDGIGVRREHH